MMLCKLSLANIKKSLKDYAIYFLTLVLGVCIFYLFNSIESQTANLIITERQSEMINLLQEILSYVSIFVSLILGFLIIYASRFLIKKRNKEFGIYMTLGMNKRSIAIVLLIETFIIGLISLGVGLALGVLLSQVTSIFVADMFEANMSKYVFTFSLNALIKTIIYFGIIYFIVMIFNTIIINKNKLINLLHSDKRVEKIKIRNPIVCIIFFIISILLLGRAYYLVTSGINELTNKDMSYMGVPIIMGVVGTILFFYSVAGLFLKIISKCKNIYYKDLNAFTFKQISTKINTMIVSISVICILLFFTLCGLSSSFSIKNYFNNSINTYAPADFEIINSNGNNEVLEYIKENIKTKDLIEISEYFDENFKERDSLGEENLKQLEKDYPFLELTENLVEVLKESDYNKLADLFHLEKISILEDEYVIIANYQTEIYQGTLDRNTILKIFGKELKPHTNKIINGFNIISGSSTNIGFFVVKDSIIENYIGKNQLIIGNYDSKDEKTINKYEENLKQYSLNNKLSFESKLEIEESSAGLSAIVTFIGLYLGIIFLISSSAILALKELSDCLDDKNKYKILRQIGTEEKEINKSLFKQTLLFFLTPLLLALVHTIFGLKFAKFILSTIGITNMTKGFITTILFLLLIYGLYFVVTYLCNKKIINEN